MVKIYMNNFNNLLENYQEIRKSISEKGMTNVTLENTDKLENAKKKINDYLLGKIQKGEVLNANKEYREYLNVSGNENKNKLTNIETALENKKKQNNRAKEELGLSNIDISQITKIALINAFRKAINEANTDEKREKIIESFDVLFKKLSPTLADEELKLALEKLRKSVKIGKMNIKNVGNKLTIEDYNNVVYSFLLQYITTEKLAILLRNNQKNIDEMKGKIDGIINKQNTFENKLKNFENKYEKLLGESTRGFTVIPR